MSDIVASRVPAAADARSTPDWQREIEQIERICVDAFLNADIEELRRYFAPDLLVNSPLERVNEGETVLDLLQRGIIRHTRCDATIEHIRRHGDIVVVMGRDEVVNEPGTPPIRRRYTNVWQQTPAGGWQMIARHAQHVQPAAK